MKALQFVLAGILVGCLISSCQGQQENATLSPEQCVDDMNKCFTDDGLTMEGPEFQLEKVCGQQHKYLTAYQCQEKLIGMCNKTARTYTVAVTYGCDNFADINKTCIGEVSWNDTTKCSPDTDPPTSFGPENVDEFICQSPDFYSNCAMSLFGHCGNKTSQIMEELFNLSVDCTAAGQGGAAPVTTTPTGGDTLNATKTTKSPGGGGNGAAGLIPSLLVQAVASIGVLFVALI